MELIKDSADIQRFVNLLNPYFRERFMIDVNELLSKYMDAQSQSQEPTGNTKTQIFAPPPLPPSNNFKLPVGKPNNLAPPPPPSGNMPMGSNGMKLKPMNLVNKTILISKPVRTIFISIFESLGYIIPDTNNNGKNALNSLPSTSEAFKYLKQIDGSTTLKQIYMMVYPSTVTPINFLEKTMSINTDNYFNYLGTGNFPKDADVAIRLGEILVALGYVDEAKIEQSLIQQRRELRVVSEDDEIAHYDEKEARKEENKNIKKDKALLGDIMVDMKYLTYQQVVYALKIQKWYRDILEASR
ncbi:MAG: hypothetical protein H7263_06815 [Candidatus Sericytochromatia bacterium]|nr:hypothetical protein [Candidatus Sericytochromatia bacterium]